MFQALVMSTLAGAATIVGALGALAVRRPGARFLAFTLGLSAGAMITVTFVELLPTAVDEIGWGWASLAFAIGIAVFATVDRIVPHDYIGQHDRSSIGILSGVRRSGALAAIGIVLHNVPEGMVTFAGALQDVRLGAAIAVAVGLHNIPEGIAVTAPILAATRDRRKALVWAMVAGLSEPAGALLAAAGLAPLGSSAAIAGLLAAVGGLMVAISLDELLPRSTYLRQPRATIVGLTAGGALMAASLLLIVG